MNEQLKAELKEYLNYHWPRCNCGCGAKDFGWLKNKILAVKLTIRFIKEKNK